MRDEVVILLGPDKVIEFFFLNSLQLLPILLYLGFLTVVIAEYTILGVPYNNYSIMGPKTLL